ncbi:hypothetical protein GGS20DRAFT_157504 [Poronia punctata]|nr:hypothetical protein GGS20DRAFT_157504 [Poronia punctata]
MHFALQFSLAIPAPSTLSIVSTTISFLGRMSRRNLSASKAKRCAHKSAHPARYVCTCQDRASWWFREERMSHSYGGYQSVHFAGIRICLTATLAVLQVRVELQNHAPSTSLARKILANTSRRRQNDCLSVPGEWGVRR